MFRIFNLKRNALKILSGSLAAVATVSLSAQLLIGNAEAARKPNILFIIMDDAGIDQFSTFGYGGPNPPLTPVINQIADKGIKFRNTWSMPECSNGRMALMTGRYPFRTQIYQAIGERDLANSHASPYDVTVPKMLKKKGYNSSLFGKYHLGGPENNEAGDGAPSSMGWDYFYGWTAGLPASIDTTAGGVGDPGTYMCGYVPSTARQIDDEGANSGACYTPTYSGTKCKVLRGDSMGNSPGLTCLSNGGVLVPNAACQKTPPNNVNFSKLNSQYVSPLVTNINKVVTQVSANNPQSRKYRSTLEVDGAISWIKAQKNRSAPWMATVSFTADHTPLQTPPGHLLSAATRGQLAAVMGGDAGSDCSQIEVQRVVSDAMIEAMDTEIGRLLTSTGLAKKNRAGQIVYDPKATNTMIVIVDDNGSFVNTVKLPFDFARSKATPYQTGVWVPLIVAGPQVSSPGREVEHMTNTVDVFGLFGELVGLDPHQAASPRTIDSQSLMPYLKNTSQTSIRNFNFTQGGLNIQEDNGHNPPCVLGASDTSTGSCSQTPVNKSVCEDNGGVWWGTGADDPSVKAVVEDCWQVNEAIYNALGDKNTYSTAKVGQTPQRYYAGRNDRFKLVNTAWLDYDPVNPGEATETSVEEFYEINQNKGAPLLDRRGTEIYKQVKMDGVVVEGQTINNLATTSGAAASYAAIVAYLEAEFASEPACPGDGNGDGAVDAKDVDGYERTVSRWTGSSVFDFDHDGDTDADDKYIITTNFTPACP